MKVRFCEWCGKVVDDRKYCSIGCRLAMKHFQKELLDKGLKLTTDQVAEYRKRELARAAMMGKAEPRKVLKAVHITSSAVKYEYVRS